MAAVRSELDILLMSRIKKEWLKDWSVKLDPGSERNIRMNRNNY